MTSDNQTVEPCPFCGAEPAISEYALNIDGDTKFAVACDCRNAPECQAFAERYVNAHGHTKAEAIAAWNVRAPASPSLGERREELAREIDRKAWDRFDRLLNGGYAEHIERKKTIEWSPSLRPSLNAADRIIALLSRPEG